MNLIHPGKIEALSLSSQCLLLNAVLNSGAMQVAQLIPLKIISQPYAHMAIPISPRSYYLNIAGWITTISPAKTLYRNFQKNILKAEQ